MHRYHFSLSPLPSPSRLTLPTPRPLSYNFLTEARSSNLGSIAPAAAPAFVVHAEADELVPVADCRAYVMPFPSLSFCNTLAGTAQPTHRARGVPSVTTWSCRL